MNRFLPFLLALLVADLAVAEGTNEQRRAQEVQAFASDRDMALLPTETVRSLLLANKDFTNDTEIIALGRKTIPGLKAILETSENSIEIQRALWVATRIHEDRTIFVEPICSLLAKKDKWVRIYAVQALGDINAIEQAEKVAILLDDKDESIRLNALKTLSRIGNETSARKISEVMERRKEVLSSEQSEKDYTLREGNKAVQEIHRRLQAKESGGSNPRK